MSSFIPELEVSFLEPLNSKDMWESKRITWTPEILNIIIQNEYYLEQSQKMKILISILHVPKAFFDKHRGLFDRFINLCIDDANEKDIWIRELAALVKSFITYGLIKLEENTNYQVMRDCIDYLKEEADRNSSNNSSIDLEYLDKSDIEIMNNFYFARKQNHLTKAEISRNTLIEKCRKNNQEKERANSYVHESLETDVQPTLLKEPKAQTSIHYLAISTKPQHESSMSPYDDVISSSRQILSSQITKDRMNKFHIFDIPDHQSQREKKSKVDSEKLEKDKVSLLIDLKIQTLTYYPLSKWSKLETSPKSIQDNGASSPRQSQISQAMKDELNNFFISDSPDDQRKHKFLE